MTTEITKETGFLRLEAIQKRNENHEWINHDLYRLMYRREFYIAAYEKIKSNPGNMTVGTNNETLDGFSLEHIDKIIEEMRTEKFQFKPARKVGIPKHSGGIRYLGIANPKDKIVQEVIRMILETIYDSPKNPLFSKYSHGFRIGRSQHTALCNIRKKWKGTIWWIEGDICACFDTVSHQVLEKILRKKIHDERFLRLIRKALKAGYYYFNRYEKSWIGIPQGSTLSPILSNIYMNELDDFMEKLIKDLNKCKSRARNKEYQRLSNKLLSLRKKGVKVRDNEYRKVLSLKRSLHSLDKFDPNYTRVRYSRFADDFLIGVAGSKKLAEEIRDRIGVFLKNKLELELSVEKTKVTHARRGKALFLGFYISTGKGRWMRIIRKGKPIIQRIGEGEIKLQAPLDLIRKRLRKKRLYRRR